MKLHITDAGDPSVGIQPQTWTVDVPFEVKLPKDWADEENTMAFKEAALFLYQDYAEGRIRALYDFEIEEQERTMQTGIERDDA